MSAPRQVLVTGGSRGIGYHIALAFARAGDVVTILAETDAVDAAAARLSAETGWPVDSLVADITDRAGLGQAIGELEAIDVLISNAGIGDMTPIDAPGHASDAVFDRLIAINLVGAYNVVRAALPRMSAGGRIVFTSSVHGQAISPATMCGYTASKGGIDAMMRSLARELGPRGITVNAVAPGMVATELTLGAVRKLFAAQIGDAEGPPPDEAAMIALLNADQAIHNLPVDPDRLAAAYLYLASDAGAAITGQVLNVDHGLMMK